MSAPLISVVLPVYNEGRVLETLTRSVLAALDGAGCLGEIVYINDGSRDEGAAILDRLAAADARVRVLHLSRNFGHQAALQAGLAHARGDAVVVMDADMQDDPGVLGRFVAKWREGYDVVYAVRVGRKENAVKRLLFFAFYRLLNLVVRIPMPADAGNFGLIDRRVAAEIARLLDRDRYYAGLRSWVGYRQVGIEVERGARYDDRPRVSLFGLFRLAKSAIFSFSSFPLTVFYLIGAAALSVFAGLAAFTLYHKLFTGLAIPGWASITMATSFFGALNALGIAVLGEYVTRIYEQVRARPMYLVARRVNFPDGSDTIVARPIPTTPLASERTPAMLAHNVYFKLKDDSAPAIEAMVAACRKYLSNHPGVVFFACGRRQQGLERPVNVLDFDVALHVVFDSKASHDAYQEAPLHHTFIDENKANWGLVRVFDSEVEAAGA